jgi:hypothetical protein
MKRLLTASVALVLANASIAPVFAESLPQQTNPATKQQLTNPATKQQLIVPEGQVMTDAELAKVEGEWAWFPQAIQKYVPIVVTGPAWLYKKFSPNNQRR